MVHRRHAVNQIDQRVKYRHCEIPYSREYNYPYFYSIIVHWSGADCTGEMLSKCSVPSDIRR